MKKRKAHIFGPEAQVKIQRTPPKVISDGDVAVRYHTIVDELETIYSAKVRDAGLNEERLKEELDTYNQIEDGLMADLAGLVSQSMSNVRGDAKGAVVEEYQQRFRDAAFAELERLQKVQKAKRELGGSLGI